MPFDGNLDYALARVHARQGRRLDEVAWRRLEASRDGSQYLDSARTTSLGDWVASLDRSTDIHTIERAMRTEWRRYVDDVTRWHPREWQGWFAWCAWLPDLSLLAQLASADPAPLWMLADPICGPVAPGSPAERASVLRTTPLAPLESVLLGLSHAGAAWRAHWLTLLPRTDSHTQQLLNRLISNIDVHAARLHDNSGKTARVLRQELSEQLEWLFRTAAGTVIATACHLAMLALDLERMRGGLVSRAALSAPAGEPA